MLSTLPYIYPPYDLTGWLGWFFLFALLVLGLVKWRESSKKLEVWEWVFFCVLLVLAPIAALFLGVQLPIGGVTLASNIPVELNAPFVMFFSAIPWVLAGGIFGPFYGTIVGLLVGLLYGFWGTHNLFTSLEVAGLALLFSYSVRQNYRSRLYRLLRHPLGSALVIMIVYIPLGVMSGFFSVSGSFVNRLDYALTQSWYIQLGRFVELLIAGCFAEVLYLGKFRLWGNQQPLEPAPSELNLQRRFFATTVPLMLIMFFTLMVSDWWVAGRVAKDLLREQLSGTAKISADSLPYFLEAGQSALVNMADPELLSLPSYLLPDKLSEMLRSGLYFRQLYLFDRDGNPITGYPEKRVEDIYLSAEENAGVLLAIRGVLVQTYTIPPWPGENTAQVSFIVAIQSDSGEVLGVLLGRTDLNSNPFTQPAIQALDSLNGIGGYGIILDENKNILYHSSSANVMTQYLGDLPADEMFIEDISASGTRRFGYYQPVLGRPWAVLLTVPAERTQSIALTISFPLLAILVALLSLTFLVLRAMLKKVTSSLENLANETTLISQGRLDHPLQFEGLDEIGRFGAAFEQMRIGLKARLDELNSLLQVSQEVASNLDVEKAIKPVLRAALMEGASAARAVLVNDVSLELPDEMLVSYGEGISSELYAYLDEQMFGLMRRKDVLTVPNTARMRLMQLSKDQPYPGALIAISLRNENDYYGTIWVSYESPHYFTDEQIRYLSTITGQAVIAAVNARLFASSDVGRQRLQAVLDSTPEPVLVFDQKNRLLLINPAVMQVPGLITSSTPGRKIEEVIAVPALLDLMVSPVEGRMTSRELPFPNGKIYYASVSPVISEKQNVGKICILRDITYYKELDNLKSDFVATVSHDLRSPLTLMRGYATMLQMVGELNDQQKEYVQKIVYGVDNMTRLVSNLLDLGRIETGIGLKIHKVVADEIVEQVLNSLKPQANQKNIQFAVDKTALAGLSEAPLTLQADPALLNQALFNLVDNAIKYTPVGGKVGVRLDCRGDVVVFEVFDSGIGVAPLDLPHMFEKFYRSGRREAYKQRGTGLGLAIVKSIVERHGGRVWVESRLGKGSSFFIAIPIQKTTK